MIIASRSSQDVDVLAVLDIQIPCHRPETPVFTPDACLPSTKTIDENLDVRKDYKDGNERLSLETC